MRLKQLTYAAGIALAMATAACSDSPAGANDYNVTITVIAPEAVSARAYGDGLKVNQLTYAVYDESGNLVIPAATKSGAFQETALKDQVQLKLVKGKTYQITFWAQSSAATCFTLGTNGCVVVDYAGVANDENRDAFYACKSVTVNANDIAETVTLTRPFAQINVGTTAADYAAAVAAGANVTKTSLALDAPSTLNMLTGAVSDPVAVNFTANALPTGDLSIKNGAETYTYLSMNYILTENEGDVINSATMGCDGQAEDKVFSLVPVKRNYRTNIVGSLFTTSADYNIVIEPAFSGDKNEPN